MTRRRRTAAAQRRSAGADGRPLDVVVLGDWLQFPHGMATTTRARLMARGLTEAGARVRVICLQATEHQSHPENSQVRGDYHGVSFEYTAGTTLRHDRFLVRRLIEAWGWVHGTLRLLELRRQDRLDVVLMWFWAPRPVGRLLFFLTLLRLLGVPVVRDIDEGPVGAEARPHGAGTRVVAARGHIRRGHDLGRVARLGRRRPARPAPRHVIEIPILVDAYETEPVDYPTSPPIVVFAGGARLSADHPLRPGGDGRRCGARIRECRSGHHGHRTSVIRTPSGCTRKVTREEYAGRVDLVGYLSREELLELYDRAYALPIPLFDDLRSRARFPTKIGEYLAAARPVVTNAVGEIPRYFTDGEDAVVCPPGDPVAFGDAVAGLLSDPARAARIGERGRRVAETRSTTPCTPASSCAGSPTSCATRGDAVEPGLAGPARLACLSAPDSLFVDAQHVARPWPGRRTRRGCGRCPPPPSPRPGLGGRGGSADATSGRGRPAVARRSR